jgi:hypothetical protein
MVKLGRNILGLVLLSSVVVAQEKPSQNVNPDAQLLAEFQDRVKKYVELHKSLEKDVAAIKESKDPEKIKGAQDALAAKIRAARPSARQGEIFTPAIGQHLRKLLSPEVKGTSGAETKEAMKEDAPAPKSVPLKINARYPEEQPLPTMPPNILASLPKLPEQLEYRIVGRDLILRDVPANLIVDFLPNAIK